LRKERERERKRFEVHAERASPTLFII